MTMPTGDRPEEVDSDEEPYVLVTFSAENENEDEDGFVLAEQPVVRKEESLQETIDASAENRLTEAEVRHQRSALWLFGALIAFIVLRRLVGDLRDLIIYQEAVYDNGGPEVRFDQIVAEWNMEQVEDASYESMDPYVIEDYVIEDYVHVLDYELDHVEDLHYERIDIVISDYLDKFKYEELLKPINTLSDAQSPSHSPSCDADAERENPAEPPRIKPVVTARIIEGIPSKSTPLDQVAQKNVSPMPIVGFRTGAPMPTVTESQWFLASQDNVQKEEPEHDESIGTTVPIPSKGSAWDELDKRYVIQDATSMQPVKIPVRSLIPFTAPKISPLKGGLKQGHLEPIPSMGQLYYGPTFNRTIQSDNVASANFVSFHSFDAEQTVQVDGAVELSDVTFDMHLTHNDDVFVAFLNPFGFSDRKLVPIWNEFAELVRSRELPLSVATVDCWENKSLCKELRINFLPVTRWFHQGRASDYTMERTTENLIQYAEKSLMDIAKMKEVLVTRKNRRPGHEKIVEDKFVPQPHYPSRIDVPVIQESNSTDNLHTCIALTESTFEDFLDQHGSVFVTFYHPCSAYKKLFAPLWNNFTEAVLSEGLVLAVASVDCAAQPALCKKQDIGPFPVLRWFEHGKVVQPDYRDSRTVKNLMKYSKNMLAAESPKGDPKSLQMTAGPSFPESQHPPVAFVKKRRRTSSMDNMRATKTKGRSSSAVVIADVAEESVPTSSSVNSNNVIKVKTAPQTILLDKADETIE